VSWLSGVRGVYPCLMPTLPPALLAVISSRDWLPTQLPDEPFGMFKAWFDEQMSSLKQPNPNSMCLATVGEDGFPRGRVVLCRGVNTSEGYLVFYTNYEGDKGREMAKNPRASATFHWDHSEVQVRFEGLIVRSPAAESDAYFAQRPWESRLSAWASRQSRPMRDRQQLLDQYAEAIERLGLTPEQLLEQGSAANIPRPPHWGGYRLFAQRVELWLGGPGRMHDRAVWTRTLTPAGEGYTGGAWLATRLQP